MNVATRWKSIVSHPQITLSVLQVKYKNIALVSSVRPSLNLAMGASSSAGREQKGALKGSGLATLKPLKAMPRQLARSHHALAYVEDFIVTFLVTRKNGLCGMSAGFRYIGHWRMYLLFLRQIHYRLLIIDMQYTKEFKEVTILKRRNDHLCDTPYVSLPHVFLDAQELTRAAGEDGRRKLGVYLTS